MVSKTVFQLKKVIQKKKEAYQKGSQSVPIHHNSNNISGGQIDTSQKTETGHEPVKTNDNNGKMVDNSRDADVSAVDQQPASHLSPKSMGIDNSVHIKPLKLDGDHSSKHRKHKSKHKHSKHHHHHRHHSSHHHKSKHKHYPHSVHAMPSGNGFIPSERVCFILVSFNIVIKYILIYIARIHILIYILYDILYDKLIYIYYLSHILCNI